jgi:hypothetical protein
MRVPSEHRRGATWEIVIDGRLDARWSEWFSGMAIESTLAGYGSQITKLTGPVADQARLRGILNKLWDLNLTLISVNRCDR